MEEKLTIATYTKPKNCLTKDTKYLIFAETEKN